MKNGAAAILILTIAFAGSAAAEDFTASITITGNTTIVVGTSTTLTAAWATNKDVNRYEWYEAGVGQGIQIIPDGAARQNGSANLTFNGTEVGEYQVCFKIWFTTGGPSPTISRQGIECVTITVVAADEECPAAPAIANAYLNDIGFTEGRGDLISALTDEMGPGNAFHGYGKCDAGYAPEVIAFVDAYLAAYYPDFEY